jgi:ribosomal protein S12 methylthiotransferase accessory factor
MEMKIFFGENKKVFAEYKGKIIETDQPEDEGGDNSAPSPFTLFLASIGTCVGFYIKSFCDKREISSQNIELIQSMEYNKETKLISKIKIDVNLPSDFPEKYKTALINAAGLCTVKKHLFHPPEVEITSTIKQSLIAAEIH